MRQKHERLFELWGMIGIKNLQENRLLAVHQHVDNIYDTMIEEEEQNLDKITKNIQKYHRERMELRRDLGVNTNDDTDEAGLGLVDVEHKIRTEVLNLREKKAVRMKVYEDARMAEKVYCDSTGSLPIEVVFDRMPTDANLKQIERHTQSLKELRSKREGEFEALTYEIRNLYEKLELEPRNSKERHIICDSIETIVLSSEILETTKSILQDLQDEMQTNKEAAIEILSKMTKISEKLNLPCDLASKKRDFYCTRVVAELQEDLAQLEQERKKHMKVFIESAANELEQMWDNCFVSDTEKQIFKAQLDQNPDDEEFVLEQYESQVQTWSKYHDQHQLIISKVTEWKTLWADKLQLETCKNDPGRLGNFKALREEEKREKRVKNKLPKVVEDIERLAKQYKSDTGKDFLIDGMVFTDINTYQQTKHDEEVKQERDKKKLEKEKLKMLEHTYGTLPTSKQTPLRGNRTLRQVKRLQHDTKNFGKDTKTFATPSKPVSAYTPGRRALRERNETFVSGSNMLIKDSIASVNENNIFDNADVASSTLKSEQIRQNLPTPIKNNAMSSLKRYNTMSASSSRSTRNRTLRSGKNLAVIPFRP
eukprot:11286.XXX_371448_373447_1 [CDS] Oithona nana genome sequencing.